MNIGYLYSRLSLKDDSELVSNYRANIMVSSHSKKLVKKAEGKTRKCSG